MNRQYDKSNSRVADGASNRYEEDDDDDNEDRKSYEDGLTEYERTEKTRREIEDEEENSYEALSYSGYSDYEINEGCLGHRDDTKCYRCLKCFHWCKPMWYNCYNRTRFSFRKFRRQIWDTIFEIVRFKMLVMTVAFYVFLSALCGVLQIRIYKQLLIYSYVHEIIITTAVQCAFIVPLLFVWWCASKCWMVYQEGLRRKNFSDQGLNNGEWMDSKIDVASETDDPSNLDCDQPETEESETKRRTYVASDCFTITDSRFYLCVSFFSFVAGGFKVLPIMILPSVLMVLVDQFGLVFMMGISFAYLGRKYDKIQMLCVALIALGLLIEIIPNYEESVRFAKDMSHDFFWRNTIYHDYNASVNHLYHFEDRSHSTYKDLHGKNTMLFREKFTNGSMFDLSRCLKNQNVTVDVDEKYSYSFYQKALESRSLNWWRDNNVAFLICIFLAIFASFPDCLSYAIMEKFWRIRDRAIYSSSASRSTVRPKKNDVKTLEIASKIVVFKLIWVIATWPFFYLQNSNLGGSHYLKYGSYCSFDNLYYDVHGVVSNDTTGNGTNAKITSVRLDGDYANENVDYPAHPNPDGSIGTNVDNVVSAYWECSPWRNGIDCENMLQLTLFYCLLDFLQYFLHVKIIRDTTNANLAWLLGIIRIGISDVIFSIPLISGAVFSSFRYFDVLSLLVITCATLVFWFHKYREEDDEEDYDNKNAKRRDDDNAHRKKMLTKIESMYESDVDTEGSLSSSSSVRRNDKDINPETRTKKKTRTTRLVLTDDESTLQF